MQSSSESGRAGCAGCGDSHEGCPHAHAHGHGAHGHEMPSETPDGPSGWRLVAIAVGLFLVPIVLAIVGALFGGESQDAQLVGALAGLAIGMGGAIGVYQAIRRSNKEENQ